jgi:hypothetical protein
MQNQDNDASEMPTKLIGPPFTRATIALKYWLRDGAEFLSFFCKSSNGFDFVTTKEWAEGLSIFSKTCCELKRFWHNFRQFLQMMQKNFDVSIMRLSWPDSWDPSCLRMRPLMIALRHLDFFLNNKGEANIN